jgi:hypothetical protein
MEAVTVYVVDGAENGQGGGDAALLPPRRARRN